MKNQDQPEKDNKPQTTCRVDTAPKCAEPPEIELELSDEEMAKVTGGTMRALNPQPLPP